MENLKLIKIAELQPTSRNISLSARVLSIGEPKEVISKRTGEKRLLAEALIGDETGTIILTLWDDKVGVLEVGNTYVFQNAFVTVFRGSMRLNIGKYGNVNKSNKEISEDMVNKSRNLSEEKVKMPSFQRRRRKSFRKSGSGRRSY